ncbi:ornithine cyclodeaminase family protein [Chitinimonas sp. BJYL2]|uniref:ornithine cyclodeaminase family protein n=1 Tax=Chitinimonas sp. BJYL2 TaxID=2976696 RepID=UPI0022B519B2|nr:NAD(P)-binding domain-containing protein [Chitinimonas sp. BJYL2]
MRLITDADVARVLNLPDAIAALHAAFTQFGEGAGAVLARNRATASHAGASVTISAMGAALPASDVVGTKVYPTVNGQFEFVINLFSAATGAPLATLAANELTRQRTAATTAVAARALVRPAAQVLAIFGAGTQARAHAEALLLVHPFSRVLVCARSGGEAFAAELQARTGVPVNAVSAATAASTADVIVTCTRASEPLFEGGLVKPGTLVCAVGSSKPVARELDDTLLSQAGRIVVEWLPAAQSEAGEFVRAGAGVIDPAKVVELGTLLAQPAVADDQAIVVYKSVGIGLEDIALAKLVYDRLQAA